MFFLKSITRYIKSRGKVNSLFLIIKNPEIPIKTRSHSISCLDQYPSSRTHRAIAEFFFSSRSNDNLCLALLGTASQMRNPYLEPMLYRALSLNGSFELGTLAILISKKIGGETEEKSLRYALKAPHWGVRQSAATALLERGVSVNPETLQELSIPHPSLALFSG